MPTVYSTDISRELYTRERCHIVEILNHNNCENLSIARARVEPGVTTEWHRLDVDEAYYILAGQGRMELNGVHETVKPGKAKSCPNTSGVCRVAEEQPPNT